MSSYYFAACYSRNPEMRLRRDELIAAIPGSTVTSRWIDCHGGELDESYTPDVLAAQPEECWRHGQADLTDLSVADAIVSFTDAIVSFTGGRHIEHGVAIAYVDNAPMLAAGAFRLIVVGPRENIFHCHPATEHHDTWWQFLEAERKRTS